jgi:hypothetical protein
VSEAELAVAACYYYKRTDVLILKHKGELTALDTEEIIRKAAESFHAARKRAGGPY